MSWRARARAKAGTLTRTARGRRGLGHLREEPDPRDRPWSAFAGAANVALPDNWNPDRQLLDFLTRIYSQRGSNSCVAQALCQALALTEARLGLPYAPRSRRWAYRMARLADGIEGDVGSRPRTMLRLVSRHGLPLEADFPWSLARLDQRPSVDLMVQGHEAAGLRYEWIQSRGDDRLREIRQAMSLGLPVLFAGPIGDSYFELDRVTGVHPWSIGRETTRGFHARCLVRAIGDDFDEVGSYGMKWASGGIARMSADYIAHDAFDLAVLWGWKRAEAQLEQLRAA